MGNFILKINKSLYTDNPNGEVVRLSKEAYNKVVDIANETGVSKKALVSQAVEYAIKHIEFKEVE